MYIGRINPRGAASGVTSSHNATSFAELFKNLRKQLVGKQACLSRAGLRCTDAAISHWERGLRLPRPRTMRNAVDVLIALGATPTEIEQLVTAWTTAYVERKVVGRNRPHDEAPPPSYPG
jgi:hypothetical protein